MPERLFLGFTLDERSYAVRLGSVRRVVRAVDCAPLPRAPAAVVGVIDCQGEIVPVYNLRRRFGLPERDIGVDDQFVLATAEGRNVAMVVDRATGIIECPKERIAAPGGALPALGPIDGVMRRDDGLTLIHNLDAFLSAGERRELDSAMKDREPHA